MPLSGKSAVFVALGLLTVLTVGGMVWSIATAPKIYDLQLQQAAANTASASGFVASVDLTVSTSINGSLSSGGQIPRKQKITLAGGIVYQAPNRILVTESLATSTGGTSVNVTETQIGPDCWQSVATRSGGRATATCNPAAVNNFLAFLRGLEKSSNVGYKNGTFYLAHRDAVTFLSSALPSLISGADFTGPLTKSVKLAATISGSYVSHEELTLGGTVSEGSGAFGVSVTEHLGLVINYSKVGSAPPVGRPAGPPTVAG
ncbi:MAG: hypothetical protein WAM97_12955 [Acidimicrobiales bacterium]